METNIQDCMKIISEARESTPNDLSPPFKKKEKGGEGKSMLGGQWKVPCLVANGRFHAWWPMEGSMLGGQWKVPCLVANGRFHVWWPMECPKLRGQWKVPCLVANGMSHAWWPMECSKLGCQWNVKEKHLFTSSIFPPITFTQTFNFFLRPYGFTLPWS
jgi:glutaredoxin